MSGRPSRTDLVDTLLHPRSIAVLGASDNPENCRAAPSTTSSASDTPAASCP
ncbi:hypothetical protein ACFQ0Q_34135 [Streptomyces aureus]